MLDHHHFLFISDWLISTFTHRMITLNLRVFIRCIYSTFVHGEREEFAKSRLSRVTASFSMNLSTNKFECREIYWHSYLRIAEMRAASVIRDNYNFDNTNLKVSRYVPRGLSPPESLVNIFDFFFLSECFRNLNLEKLIITWKTFWKGERVFYLKLLHFLRHWNEYFLQEFVSVLFSIPIPKSFALSKPKLANEKLFYREIEF